MAKKSSFEHYSHLETVNIKAQNPRNPLPSNLQVSPSKDHGVHFNHRSITSDNLKDVGGGFMQTTQEPIVPPRLSPVALTRLPFSSQHLQEKKTLLKKMPIIEPQTYLDPIATYNFKAKPHKMKHAPTSNLPDYEELPDYEDIHDAGQQSIVATKSPTPPPRKRPFPNSPIHYQSESKLTDQCVVAPSEEYVASSDEMTLGYFVSNYENQLPVHVRVCRGFYGTSDQWSISEDEYFNIHFIKKTKMVSVWDGCFGSYSVPINSAAKFGYLYIMGDSEDVSKGVKGYCFPTVGDILEVANPPPIVKVQSNFIVNLKPQQSVHAGDLLRIKGNKGRVNKMLMCLEIKSGSQKLLSLACKGNFTTCPKDTQMFLPDVIEHFSLPSNFMMFINSDSVSASHEMSFTHRVQLKNCKNEISLIATQLDKRISGDGETFAPAIVEIPIDLDIGIELIKSKESKTKQLYDETEKLYDTLDIASIQSIPSNIETLQQDPATAEALITCNKENKNIGIEIQQPPRYSKTRDICTTNFTRHQPPSTNPAVPTPPHQVKKSKSLSFGKLSRNEVPSSALEMKMNDLESLMNQYEDELQRLKANVLQMEQRQQSLHSMHTALQYKLNRLNIINSSSDILESRSAYSTLNGPSFSNSFIADVKSPKQESLDLLTTDEVIKVIKGLGLQQYLPLFQSNMIDGKRLSEMTETDLKHLGVSDIHVTSIMKVVRGIVSFNDILASPN